MNPASEPFFITFEGGEGAGKSTLIWNIAHVLRGKGYSVVETREPGGSQLGDTIRQILLNHDDKMKISNVAELFLFLASRAQHIEELIKPSLAAGKIVLCDRFNDSTVAYQSAGRGVDDAIVQSLCKIVSEEVPVDLTLFLDVDPIVGLSRTRKASKENSQIGAIDRIESETLYFHERVREAYRELAKQDPKRIQWIEANQTQEKVLADALAVIEIWLKI